jgi:hypothetical protein
MESMTSDVEDQAAGLVEDQAAELAAAELAARASGQPVILELGRYRVFQAPDGGWVIARAVDTCERCQACGCGTQAEPIAIPAMVIKVATMQGAGLADKLRALRAGRRTADD